jgi:UPF0716 family protein affecting phage T7 exclusion
MDRKDRRLIRGIILTNIIVVMVSIFLWVRYGRHIGILITIVLMWSSFIAVRIIMNRHGIYAYHCTRNCFVDRLIEKVMKW